MTIHLQTDSFFSFY